MARIALSFVLGVFVATLLAGVGLLVATMALDSAGVAAVDLRLGAIRFYEFSRGTTGVTSGFGPGLALVLLLAGVANAAGARTLRMRNQGPASAH